MGPTTSPYVAQAQQAMARGDCNEGLRLAEQALAANPDDARAHLVRGVCLGRSGDTAGAVGAFEAAVALDPRDPTACVNLAMAYRGQGRIQDAIVHLERALTLDPTLDRARTALDELRSRMPPPPSGALAEPEPPYVRAGALGLSRPRRSGAVWWIVGGCVLLVAAVGAGLVARSRHGAHIGTKGPCLLSEAPYPSYGLAVLVKPDALVHRRELARGGLEGDPRRGHDKARQMLQDPKVMYVPWTVDKAQRPPTGETFAPATGDLQVGVTRDYIEQTYGRPDKTKRIGDHTALYYDGGAVVLSVNSQGNVCLIIFW